MVLSLMAGGDSFALVTAAAPAMGTALPDHGGARGGGAAPYGGRTGEPSAMIVFSPKRFLWP